MISLVVPVYRNADGVPALLTALAELHEAIDGDLEVVLVVDGSPDDSHALLSRGLVDAPYPAQILGLSRNFGSFAAIRAGLAAARGEHMAVMAADLQEPPELISRFRSALAGGEYDVVIGQRSGRDDPGASKLASTLFWGFYRRFVQRAVPPGGVDVFGCTRAVRDHILSLEESNSSLVGLLLWVGYRRVFVPYERRARETGASAWTLGKRLRYLSDSIFSFTDLPIRVLLHVGTLGLVTSVVFASVVLVAKLTGSIPLPGYAATVLVVTFFGALNCFGLGLIGGYVWRTFENTKRRPNYIVATHDVFRGERPPGTPDDE